MSTVETIDKDPATTQGETTMALRLFSSSVSATLGTAAVAQEGEPIKIGIPVGLSCSNSGVAPSVVQSAELAVEEINEAGGVLGRKLTLEIADDASGAAGAQKAYDALIF